MDEQVDPRGVVFFEVLVHFQALHHTAGQHAVRLPALVILKRGSFYYSRVSSCPAPRTSSGFTKLPVQAIGLGFRVDTGKRQQLNLEFLTGLYALLQYTRLGHAVVCVCGGGCSMI